ncbi:MAG: pentose kinase [Clostridiales Family XIII bacterium]|jgi:xylulokinase|nr:pentose kinase [Clostridiales Family XIII bacterium]
MEKIVAYDLGTGGIKGVLYDQNGLLLADVYRPYRTYYPHAGWHEQAPSDWWHMFIECTRDLLEKTSTNASDISCLALSGHSCGAVPIDGAGSLLRKHTPIWSDTRAKKQSERFLANIPFDDWYGITGANMPGTYTVFKIMWYMDNEPDMMRRVYKIVGTKDYINYLLTGTIATDHSYASSTGVYDLRSFANSDRLIEASGVDRRFLPDIIMATDSVGEVSDEAASLTGLRKGTTVICGGVDNACMALGSGGVRDGRIYTNLGSSAWIAITTGAPLIDHKIYTNVFSHILHGKYASAATIFSAGNAFRWVRDTFCADLTQQAEAAGKDVYDLMTESAARAPIGANKLIFNPTLSMGTPLDFGVHTKGAFAGLDLRHTLADILRASMEGITMGLGRNLKELQKQYRIADEMLLVGGGSNSQLWMQIFADIYGMPVRRTNVGQNAGALGAAATAAVGTGIWDDFSIIDKIHVTEHVAFPVPEHVEYYNRLAEIHKDVAQAQGAIGDRLANLEHII